MVYFLNQLQLDGLFQISTAQHSLDGFNFSKIVQCFVKYLILLHNADLVLLSVGTRATIRTHEAFLLARSTGHQVLAAYCLFKHA